MKNVDYKCKLNGFQYPSSRVILPDSEVINTDPPLSDPTFQYPSSRVILPDELFELANDPLLQ